MTRLRLMSHLTGTLSLALPMNSLPKWIDYVSFPLTQWNL